jgi:hypothetical protein
MLESKSTDFRKLIETALYPTKAYNLPAVCERLGLAPGDQDEAYSSKTQYVRSRLERLGAEEIVTLARKILKDFATFDLEEAIAILDEEGSRKVSEITRQKVRHALVTVELSGSLPLLDLLSAFWPIKTMLHEGLDMESLIARHMLRNDDWDNAQLLAYLGADTCSQERFFRFLEEVLHPKRRDEDDQRRLVELLNTIIGRDGFTFAAVDSVSGYPVYKVMEVSSGVRGVAKNLIFAANGPKPELVFADAINNDIEIVKNAEYCLVYDRPVSPTGLRWEDMVEWWKNINSDHPDPERQLYLRLQASLNCEPERLFFRSYFKSFMRVLGSRLPALVPQVYLHYDPYTFKMLSGNKRLPRQRMDFLLLLSRNERIVIEIDGKQHYANGDQASPALYSEMVSADRKLRLAGYEVYRFGGAEFMDGRGEELVGDFVSDLFRKHGIK